jgi:hypothetical protein
MEKILEVALLPEINSLFFSKIELLIKQENPTISHLHVPSNGLQCSSP